MNRVETKDYSGADLMKTIRLTQKTDKDGSLSLVIPLGHRERDYEVLVVIQPAQGAIPSQKPEDRGWPKGYFEQTYGSIDDETFFRRPQGDLPKPVELD